MKISCFYPENLTAAWSCTIGVADELERMGHKVERVALKPPPARNKVPKLEELRVFDLILMLGMEHFWQVIYGAFGDAWKKFPVQRVAWAHESAFREDYNPITSEVLPWADEWFFPAAQDAEFFDQEHFVKDRAHWLPFGVDDHVFMLKPDDWPKHFPYGSDKLYDCAFIGGIYPKRQNFLARLSRHLDEKMVFECGNVVMQDLSGSLMREQTKLYAENLRQIKVFVNLPALSQHQVTKVFEVLACGTFLITPALEGAAAKNMSLFRHKEELYYYPENHLGYLAQLMRDWTSEEKAEEREKVARAGHEAVMAKHTLRHRLNEMFAILKFKTQPEERAQTAAT